MCDIKYAAERGVTTVTFDNVGELKKAVLTAPGTKLILRIYANDPNAQCILSNKFGAYETEWESLLTEARQLGANLVGISFHVGSGASSPEAFTQALAAAARLQRMARDGYGFALNIVDIGGGFSQRTFPRISAAIREAIADYFMNDDTTRFIAEPGRFFAETAADFYTPIIGRRALQSGGFAYTIADGLYGSFNCILYDHAHVPNPEYVRHKENTNTSLAVCTVFGPSCDGLDQVVGDCLLPVLEIGDFLVWRNFGAYTISGASHAFNGIPFYNIASYNR
jgi:ornithine decarboxylase